jgi:hypothetical protein
MKQISLEAKERKLNRRKAMTARHYLKFEMIESGNVELK